ncbi:gp 5.3, partial [Enterobacteria phage 3/7]
MGGVA